LNLEDKVFLGKFQLKTAQTYRPFFFRQIDVEISQATLIPCTKQCAIAQRAKKRLAAG